MIVVLIVISAWNQIYEKSKINKKHFFYKSDGFSTTQILRVLPYCWIVTVCNSQVAFTSSRAFDLLSIYTPQKSE